MAGGLVALLDDVAALAKLAAASVDDVGAAAGRASAKAAGVVVDDAAVTPRYVRGLEPNRELAIIGRIAKGSMRNKLLFILPAALLLSQYLPWLLTPILMVGGTYLVFEGAEKVWELVAHRGEERAASDGEPVKEDAVVSGAVRTDFILSAEIMVIALNEVADEPFLSRAAILIVVAIAITVLVYGAVALIVKMDDIGLHLVESSSSGLGRGLGTGLVKAMPKLLAGLSALGIVAMLWVGGHILLVGADELGWQGPYDLVKDGEKGVGEGVLGWFVNTGASAVIGLVVGAVVVVVVHQVHRLRHRTAR